MHLEQVQLNFEKRRIANGLEANLQPGVTHDALDAAEDRIGLKFPDQVRAFYSEYNGLRVDDPRFEILSLNRLSVDDQSRIQFATADDADRICFDCSCFNEAGQWDIIEPETGDRITYTMASFWSNKMWKWIDRRLRFWRGEV